MLNPFLIDPPFEFKLSHYDGLLRKVRPSRAQEPRQGGDHEGCSETESYSGLRSWKDAQDIKE